MYVNRLSTEQKEAFYTFIVSLFSYYPIFKSVPIKTSPRLHICNFHSDLSQHKKVTRVHLVGMSTFVEILAFSLTGGFRKKSTHFEFRIY